MSTKIPGMVHLCHILCDSLIHCTLVPNATCRFVETGPLIPEIKIFEGFFTIYGHGSHPSHVTWIIHKHIGSPRGIREDL